MIKDIVSIMIRIICCLAIGFSGAVVYKAGKKSKLNSRENEKLWSALARQELRIDELSKKRAVRAIVTGYSSEVRQTDSTPHITAYMTKVRPGLVAVSWNLAEDGWTRGYCLWIDGVGVREIDDSMKREWKGSRVDIWFHSRSDALKFGKRRNVLVLLLGKCKELRGER